MPSLYARMAAAIASNRTLMWVLISCCLLGLPLAWLAKFPGAMLAVGLLWYLVLIVVWFQPKAVSQFTPFGAWAYAIGLDVFLIVLVFTTIGGAIRG